MKVYAVLVSIMVLSLPLSMVQAQDTLSRSDTPVLEAYANKDSFEAGEHGFVIVVLETYGKMESALIEVEVLSPSGKFTEGDILYTKIPQESVFNEQTSQTAQIIYSESVEYFTPQKTIFRLVDFDVPINAKTGDYKIAVRVTGADVSLVEEDVIGISGPGGFLDIIFLAYIVVLAISLFYLLRRV